MEFLGKRTGTRLALSAADMTSRPQLSLLVAALCCGGCGASRPAAHATLPRAARVSVAPVAPARARPHMQTYGLTGSLASDEVRHSLAGSEEAFATCFTRSSARMPSLGGRVTLSFHVARDGTVARVHPVDSTVGHRDVERCITEVAQSTRFPRPHGGEADFTWPLEMDPPAGVREPITWDPARVRALVRARGRDVLEACGSSTSTIQVTTYVSHSGRVLSAGASTHDPELAGTLDCVARAVRHWHMPRPGTRQAKVTFELGAASDAG